MQQPQQERGGKQKPEQQQQQQAEQQKVQGASSQPKHGAVEASEFDDALALALTSLAKMGGSVSPRDPKSTCQPGCTACWHCSMIWNELVY